MATANKIETFPIQLLGLAMITVDSSIQSRARMSIEDQRDFSEAMLRGDEFPPIVVFFDGKKNYLADGFHRYGARKSLSRTEEGFDQIKAEVRPGSRTDAIVFSAGANQKFSIKRTSEDIKKSIFLLLDLPDWQNASLKKIENHVGVSGKLLKTYRCDYEQEKGFTLPNLLVGEDGKLRYCSPSKPKVWEKKVAPSSITSFPQEQPESTSQPQPDRPSSQVVAISLDPIQAASQLKIHFVGDRLSLLISETSTAGPKGVDRWNG